MQRQAGWDALVRFDRSRYSIPPQHAGRPVLVEAYEQKIVIRSGDLIIAEHQRASRPDSSIVTTDSYINGLGIDDHLRQTNTTTGVSYFLTDHRRQDKLHRCFWQRCRDSQL